MYGDNMMLVMCMILVGHKCHLDMQGLQIHDIAYRYEYLFVTGCLLLVPCAFLV